MINSKFNSFLKTKQCVFWDWNGTLLDDVDYSLGITNNFLESKNCERITIEHYLESFTIPVREFYERLKIEKKGITFDEISQDYLSNYILKKKSLALFDGTKESLGKISEAGVNQVLFSAACTFELKELLAHHDLQSYFSIVSGASGDVGGCKLDRGIKLKENHDFKNGVLVGDTLHDMEIGKEIGFETVWVSEGHQSINSVKNSKAVDYIFNRRDDKFFKN